MIYKSSNGTDNDTFLYKSVYMQRHMINWSMIVLRGAANANAILTQCRLSVGQYCNVDIINTTLCIGHTSIYRLWICTSTFLKLKCLNSLSLHIFKLEILQMISICQPTKMNWKRFFKAQFKWECLL